MQLYRIAKTEFIRDLSGYGASRSNNRWNSKGMEMLYTSTARSLALLEVMVHVPINLLKDMDLSIITLEINPKHITEISDLPKSWMYDTKMMRNVGDRWLRSLKSVGLIVPSAIIPEEKNMLLNPNVNGFSAHVKVLDVTKFEADKRLSSFNFSS